LIDYDWQLRFSEIAKKRNWIIPVLGWHTQGLVSDQEMKDMIEWHEKNLRELNVNN